VAPPDLDSLNAQETAKLLKDPPEGVDPREVLTHEQARDEPRAVVLKAAVAAELITEDEAKAITAAAAGRRAAASVPRFPVSRLLAEPRFLEQPRYVLVGAFHDAGVEDDEELTIAEAERHVAKFLERPINADDDQEA
jgi:hypothetical protein